MPPDENTPAQISEENKPENLVGQATLSENPAPPEPVPVPENIPEPQPIEPTPPEEIKSEPISTTEPAQEISQPEPTPQIITDPANPEVSKMPFDTTSLLPKLKEKLSLRTEKRLSKIIELARKNGEIQNDEVEKLLHVSDASASRYLSKLVQRGSLRVSGPKNHAKYLPN